MDCQIEHMNNYCKILLLKNEQFLSRIIIKSHSVSAALLLFLYEHCFVLCFIESNGDACDHTAAVG